MRNRRLGPVQFRSIPHLLRMWRNCGLMVRELTRSNANVISEAISHGITSLTRRHLRCVIPRRNLGKVLKTLGATPIVKHQGRFRGGDLEDPNARFCDPCSEVRNGCTRTVWIFCICTAG